jgi:hypothetical protein
MTQLASGIRALKIPIFLQDGKLVACHGINEGVKRDVKKAIDEWIKEKIKIKFVEKAAKATVKKLLPDKIGNIYFAPENSKPGDLDPATVPLEELLAKVRAFLDLFKSDVVTIFLEVYYKDPAMILAAFKASGLEPYLHLQKRNTPWPRLSEMISSDHRLVVFVDFYLDTKKYPFNEKKYFISSTPYNFSSADELKKDTASECPQKDKLWVMQHFVTIHAGGSKSQAEKANNK